MDPQLYLSNKFGDIGSVANIIIYNQSTNLTSKNCACLALGFLHLPNYKPSSLSLLVSLRRGQLFLQQCDLTICSLRCKQLLFDINQLTSDFIDLTLHSRIGISSVDSYGPWTVDRV